MSLEKLKENKKYIIVVVLCVIFFVRKCGILEGSYNYDDSVETNISTENEISEEENLETTQSTLNTIYVDLKGAVEKPGVYEMKEGDRTIDLLNKAGGMTHENSECVNLSHKLVDEEVINIPTSEEMCGTHGNSTHNTGEDEGKININEASATELETLSGIGSTRAEAIISYREENGKFIEKEDLKNVSGIGDSTYNNIEEEIVV